jgi:hypothetical protein
VFYCWILSPKNIFLFNSFIKIYKRVMSSIWFSGSEQWWDQFLNICCDLGFVLQKLYHTNGPKRKVQKLFGLIFSGFISL